MAATHWIVDPSYSSDATMGLRPGFYKARLHKDAGWSLVHAQVIEDRDETGDLMADVEYKLQIDGNFVLDWYARFPNGLTGDRISEQEFRALQVDMPWTREHWGVEAGQKDADLTKLPPITVPE